jgi:hypothetical protein
LAVALDRLGEHHQALVAASKAVEAHGRTLGALEAEGVFFEPAHERHYYRALALEALATLVPAQRAEHLEHARRAYAAFVRGATRAGRDVHAAQTNLVQVTRLTHELARGAKAKRTLDGLSRKPIRPSAGAR